MRARRARPSSSLAIVSRCTTSGPSACAHAERERGLEQRSAGQRGAASQCVLRCMAAHALFINPFGTVRSYTTSGLERGVSRASRRLFEPRKKRPNKKTVQKGRKRGHAQGKLPACTAVTRCPRAWRAGARCACCAHQAQRADPRPHVRQRGDVAHARAAVHLRVQPGRLCLGNLPKSHCCKAAAS